MLENSISPEPTLLPEGEPGEALPPLALDAESAAEPQLQAALEQATEPVAQSAPAIADLTPAACAARLAELFPAVFTPGRAQPLKLRIQADIQVRAPGVFTRKTLSAFLHRHTTSTAYLKALVNAPQRIDLDGAPAGDVAEEHRAAAGVELERRRALHDARRAAEREAQRLAQRDSRRAAHEQARREHDEARRAQAAQEQARRESDGLLRAYESSTLTRANFCALKGIAEADLEALLAQARLAPRAAPLPSPPQAFDRGARPPSARPPRQRPAHPGKPAR